MKVKRVGIRGTDLYAYEGTQPHFKYLHILGHELSAVVLNRDEEIVKLSFKNLNALLFFNLTAGAADNLEKNWIELE